MQREEFIKAKRIVIKLGTNIIRNEDGEVALSRIYSFIEDISKLVKNGKEVIVVTLLLAIFSPVSSLEELIEESSLLISMLFL